MTVSSRHRISPSARRFPGAALRPPAIAIAALLLGGCSTFSRDGGIDAVAAATSDRIGQAITFPQAGAGRSQAEAAAAQLLAQPLSADSAVRIALLNNRGLRASFAQLGVAEADLVQAGRLRNPSLSFGRLSGAQGVEIDRGVMFDIVGLLTIPLRREIEQRNFGRAQLQAASDAVRLAADTRRAYFTAVAAQQSALYSAQVRSSADAGAELATRMAAAGNFSKLDQMREQAFQADATAQLARARHEATAARERLSRLLGAQAGFALPDRLPELPAAARGPAGIEAQAIEQRLDVQMARRETETTASSLGLARTTGFINVLQAGYANKSVAGERQNGYDIALELPLFDWGGARTAKAEALYMQSVERTADAAMRARSEAREAYSAYLATYEVARHYRDHLIPLRKKISEETLLRYNGMLIGVFDLLADARAQIGSVNAAIEAQRDFWLADTDLQAAVNGAGATRKDLP
jgi:outer membrane protein TolC